MGAPSYLNTTKRYFRNPLQGGIDVPTEADAHDGIDIDKLVADSRPAKSYNEVYFYSLLRLLCYPIHPVVRVFNGPPALEAFSSRIHTPPTVFLNHAVTFKRAVLPELAVHESIHIHAQQDDGFYQQILNAVGDQQARAALVESFQRELGMGDLEHAEDQMEECLATTISRAYAGKPTPWISTTQLQKTMAVFNNTGLRFK